MEHRVGQIAEYGTDEFNNNKSVFEILEEKDYITVHGLKRHAEFFHRTEGYKEAGSCATWTLEVWGFRRMIDGSWWGEHSQDKQAMKAKYDKLGQD